MPERIYGRMLPAEQDLDLQAGMLKENLPVTEIYYPVAQSCGEGVFGFDFHFNDLRLRSWSMIEQWCAVTEDERSHSRHISARCVADGLDSVADTSVLAELAVTSNLQCGWMFIASAGGLTSETKFSISLDLNAQGDQPLALRLGTPIDAPESLYPLVRKFWEGARSMISCLSGGRIVTTSDAGERPLLVLDDPGYMSVPRIGSRPRGIVVKRNVKSNAVATLSEILAFLESMSPELNLFAQMTEVTLDQSGFEQHAATLYEVSPAYDFVFTGRYRNNFSPDSVAGVFPQDGYWRLPLVGLDPGEDSPVVQADSVRTPFGNFIEFTAGSEEDLRKCLGTSPFAKELEMWEGPPHLRWGLDELARR